MSYLARIAFALIVLLAACQDITQPEVETTSSLSPPLFSTGASGGPPDLVNVNFDADIPGQPPATGGPGQPTFLIRPAGTSVLVQAVANGIATQPVVVAAQAANQFASVTTRFSPISDGVVRAEATVAFDRLAAAFFLQTSAGSGPFPSAVVTRLIVTEGGDIQDFFGTVVGAYVPNQPFRVRMDIDMSADEWSVVIDNELNGFNDDPVVSHLPFTNPATVLPTVGGIWASMSLFFRQSVAPTAVAYDDIRVFVPVRMVAVDIKPGSDPNSINCTNDKGVIPVAILTTPDFDATAVDHTTVTFEGATETHIDKKTGLPRRHEEDVDGDGDTDLVFHFRFGDTSLDCSSTEGTLTGETLDGTPIEGTDAVRMVGG